MRVSDAASSSLPTINSEAVVSNAGAGRGRWEDSTACLGRQGILEENVWVSDTTSSSLLTVFFEVSVLRRDFGELEGGIVSICTQVLFSLSHVYFKQAS